MKRDSFGAFFKTLSEEERRRVLRLIAGVHASVELSKKQRRLMIGDFENAIKYYYANSRSMDEIETLLSPERLGSFYSRKVDRWYRLCSAAKLYPLSMSRNWMSLFHIAAYMRSDVVPALLQIALTFTIQNFPYFATTVKRGFFWHYLDSTQKRYTLLAEQGRPCMAFSLAESDAQPFRVFYYKNRISLECFHILTDGGGAMVFLQALLAEYVRLLGEDVSALKAVPDNIGWTDDFTKVIPEKKQKSLLEKGALQLDGELMSRHYALTFEMSAEKLRQVARENQATISEFAVALIMLASRECITKTHGSVNIQLPVNMRKYYGSTTMQNFSMYCVVSVPIEEIKDFQGVLAEVKRQVEVGTSASELNKKMLSANSIVDGVKYIPLRLKRPITRMIYGVWGDASFTNTLSNMGYVKLPPELDRHVLKMDCLLGGPIKNRAACTLISMHDTAVLGITKKTTDPTFEETLLRLLEGFGLSAQVYGSD